MCRGHRASVFFFTGIFGFTGFFCKSAQKKTRFFFSLPDIYHAKNRDKTGETESQKKGIFLAISLSVGRRESLGIRSTLIPLGPSAIGSWPTPLPFLLTLSQELCNIHYIVHIYTSSISISISYLFDFHFVFTPATCPCVFRRRVSFLQGFFRKSA